MHQLYAKTLFLISGIAIVGVASGIIAFFPNNCSAYGAQGNCINFSSSAIAQINPMNYIIPLPIFLLGLFVWFYGGKLEGEED